MRASVRACVALRCVVVVMAVAVLGLVAVWLERWWWCGVRRVSMEGVGTFLCAGRSRSACSSVWLSERQAVTMG